MSSGLDPDQDLRSVGPDLGPRRLQRLSADKIVVAGILRKKVEVNKIHCFTGLDKQKFSE